MMKRHTENNLENLSGVEEINIISSKNTGE